MLPLSAGILKSGLLGLGSKALLDRGYILNSEDPAPRSTPRLAISIVAEALLVELGTEGRDFADLIARSTPSKVVPLPLPR